MTLRFRQALVILLVLVALAAVHLFIYIQNIGLKYKVTDIKIQLGELKSKNRLLASQVAARESLPVIAQLAHDKLGMAYPEKIIYIVPSHEAGGRAASPNLPPFLPQN